ncbi:MarR family winged helix-turn-helix transcriptional regulator [Salinibacterium sp. SWN1162]|uniref:MarR family winged helix-turn-helix transcriptional regulator n=1 Tax=Salinibacterium sp. SWN1162 TaxID=2792053 RepID=UPI0018CCDAD7|nr:MarR family winged helix-turn-helix transcriptional regulator [Salinibacterium sp. SWN1162]MBH0008155.1 winged helix-turn-helix transcriptional regulator [Salinibacterium sp. SWN1162]
MTNAREMDDRENAVWRGFVSATQQLASSLDRHLVQDAQLSGPEHAVLTALTDHAEQSDTLLRARDLGFALGWDRSRLSHLLKRMETRGLLERTSCPSDARGLNVQITADGLEAVRQASSGYLEFVRTHFLDLLTREEQDALASVSDKIKSTLEPQCDSAAAAS